jgi:hypothetical protein
LFVCVPIAWLRGSFQGEVIPAIQGANRILELSKDGSRFNLEDRARISTDLKALVGQLRIPFTGPGVLTDKEYDRLLETIGNPNEFFALPSIERIKVETVIDKLSKDLKERYRQAGIKDTQSKRERLIEVKMSQTKAPREQIEKTIDNLVNKGILSQEYKIGF